MAFVCVCVEHKQKDKMSCVGSQYRLCQPWFQTLFYQAVLQESLFISESTHA